MPRRLTAYYPGRSFPALSITGDWCGQQCDHCQGRYLRSMAPVTSPDSLLEAAYELDRNGAKGFLLSGGCDAEGRVPIGPYVDAIASIKCSTDLKVNLHTGFLDRELAERLVDAGTDVFSIDVVQDPEAISNIMHLSSGKIRYVETLEALTSVGANIVPHVLVGMGSAEGERGSLDLISRFRPAGMVVLILMPNKGIAERPISITQSRTVDLISEASRTLSCPILLGCMRPRGNWELEIACIKAGVQGMASPSSRTLEWAKEAGFEITIEEACCSLHL